MNISRRTWSLMTALLLVPCAVAPLNAAGPVPSKLASKQLAADGKAILKALRSELKLIRNDLAAAIAIYEAAAIAGTLDSGQGQLDDFAFEFDDFQQRTSDAIEILGVDALNDAAQARLNGMTPQSSLPHDFDIGDYGLYDTLRRRIVSERDRHYAAVRKRLALLAKRTAQAPFRTKVLVEPAVAVPAMTFQVGGSILVEAAQPLAIDYTVVFPSAIYVGGSFPAGAAGPVDVRARSGQGMNTTVAGFTFGERFVAVVATTTEDGWLISSLDADQLPTSSVAVHSIAP